MRAYELVRRVPAGARRVFSGPAPNPSRPASLRENNRSIIICKPDNFRENLTGRMAEQFD